MIALIHVKQFLEQAKAGDIDKHDFYAKVSAEIQQIQQRYAPFITINQHIEAPEKTGALGMLPISVKDCICTEGMQTTAGSKVLEGYIPPFDATCMVNVKQEGGVIIGKTAQDEFGFGTFSTSCAYEVPRNPYDTERSCGGSSGGAACITAAATFPHMAIAESTGGSITAPAAFTGTVGLTPTYGRVSRYGLIDYSNSMDKIGIISKQVYDAALGLSVIAGHDAKDSTSANKPKHDYTHALDKSIKKMRIGIPNEYLEGVDQKIAGLFHKRVSELENDGAVIQQLSLPMTKFAVASYYIIAMSEASTNLAKYSGLRYGMQDKVSGSFGDYFSRIRSLAFGEEAKRRIIMGTYARAVGFRDAYYLKALKIRKLMIDEFRHAFGTCDVLISPSMPLVAPRFDEIAKLTPVQNYSMDKLTTAPNMAGVPQLSMPMGLVDGLPAGMQIIANHFDETKLFTLGLHIEMLKWMQ